MEIGNRTLAGVTALLFSLGLSGCGSSGGGSDSSSTSGYSVGGSVSGLSGSGLVLQNSSSDDLSISSNGTFTFSTELSDTDSYSVTVATQPSSPDQFCSVSNASGTISGSNISDVTVSCTDYYTISGTVSGLTGSGLVLQNNSGDDLSISADGAFTFATQILDGSDYSITIATQPGSPTQTCSIGSGSGTVNGSAISNITVTCEGAYTIGGTVSGLSGSGLVLQNNGGDNLSVSADGSFTFSTGVVDNGNYSVSVYSSPASPSQSCTVGSGSGTISSSDVSNVTVSCTTNSFSIGGSVSGLTGSGLVLQNNGGDDLAINADGAFTFATDLTDLSDYSVTVATQPGTPDQICTVTNGSGALNGSVISDITVNCATAYTLSGTISGIIGGSVVVLQNNGGDELSLNINGGFSFATKVADGADYAVDISIQPTDTSQYCNVIYGTGTIAAADVSNVEVVCVAGLYNVIDTDQTDCYNATTGTTLASCTGSGQDGETSGLQPSYTSYTMVTDEAVVLDDNTGLMWQASSDTDGVSGLNDDDKMTYDEAATYCSGLDYGSYSDWRVPTIKELYSIYLMSGQDISGEPGATTNGTYVDTTGIPPFIDTNYFDVGYGDIAANERIIDGQYVSATLNLSGVYSGFTYSMVDGFFGLNYVDGHLKAYEKDASNVSDARYYVRCVRGNPDYGTNNFSDNGNGTVSDNATNLMWEQADHHTNDFDDALSVCAAATTGSWTDWRLPNIKELHSLLDYDNAPDVTGNPAIDTAYFSTTSFTNEAGDNPDYGYFWSSTALLSSSGKGNKGAYITFGRGLGYINNTVVDVHGAGAQRSDGKTDVSLSSMTSIDVSSAGSTFGDTAYSSGPQGDIVRIVNNYARCVRDNVNN